MNPGNLQPLVFCIFHHINDFIKVHQGTVVNNSSLFCICQYLWIDQRTCINDDICAVNNLLSLNRQQFRISRTRSNK